MAQSKPRCWAGQELPLSLAESGFHTHPGLRVTPVWFQNKQTQNLEQKNKNNPKQSPSRKEPNGSSSLTAAWSHQGCGDSRDQVTARFLLSPNANFSHFREKKGTEVNLRLLHAPQSPAAASPPTGCRGITAAPRDTPCPCPIPAQLPFPVPALLEQREGWPWLGAASLV